MGSFNNPKLFVTPEIVRELSRHAAREGSRTFAAIFAQVSQFRRARTHEVAQK
jgi:hypothetical protein